MSSRRRAPRRRTPLSPVVIAVNASMPLSAPRTLPTVRCERSPKPSVQTRLTSSESIDAMLRGIAIWYAVRRNRPAVGGSGRVSRSITITIMNTGITWAAVATMISGASRQRAPRSMSAAHSHMAASVAGGAR